jgi:hypothetical protein
MSASTAGPAVAPAPGTIRSHPRYRIETRSGKISEGDRWAAQSPSHPEAGAFDCAGNCRQFFENPRRFGAPHTLASPAWDRFTCAKSRTSPPRTIGAPKRCRKRPRKRTLTHEDCVTHPQEGPGLGPNFLSCAAFWPICGSSRLAGRWSAVSWPDSSQSGRELSMPGQKILQSQ